MKYHVYPNSRDGVWLATRPEPIHLSQVGYEIASFLTRFKQQGYFSNCRQEHLSLDTMEFRILPASVDPYEKEQTIPSKGCCTLGGPERQREERCPLRAVSARKDGGCREGRVRRTRVGDRADGLRDERRRDAGMIRLICMNSRRPIHSA